MTENRLYVIYALRAIFRNYDAVAAYPPNVLLLRSRPQPRFGTPEPVETVRVPWNTWVPVPPRALLAAPTVERSLVLRFIRTVFREDPLFVALRFASGERAIYRVVLDNMHSGLWLNPFAATYDGVPPLLNQGTGRRVVAIRFLGLGSPVSMLTPAVRVTWYQLPLPATR